MSEVSKSNTVGTPIPSESYNRDVRSEIQKAIRSVDAVSKIEALLDRVRIDELDKLSDEMQEAIDAFRQTHKNMAKKGSGVEGLAPGMRSNYLGRIQAKRLVDDRLSELSQTHSRATKEEGNK